MWVQLPTIASVSWSATRARYPRSPSTLRDQGSSLPASTRLPGSGTPHQGSAFRYVLVIATAHLVLFSKKYSHRENFHLPPPTPMGEFFLSCVYGCIEPIMEIIIPHGWKFYSPRCFYNAMGRWVSWMNFCPAKSFDCTVLLYMTLLTVSMYKI